MIANPLRVDPGPVTAPVDNFSLCHAGILSGLEAFTGLPELAQAAERSRRVAQATLSLLDHAVLEHHADEESELFPAVLRSAAAGEERAQVLAMIDRLVAEHRAIEEAWKKLKPAVRQAAGAGRAELSAKEVEALLRAYGRHAAFEEQEFLPLARDILGRNGNHMAALGLSLHLRHAPQPAGYI